ncbi:CYTH domain-containing protein [Bacillus tuaregi]|uniref:CYTH domain-containing protein n=1 Tax=Bacillus tuaregi TaxID=1816695 RepID=UPI0008F94587|nr:CYTH domain-containing protein [Bacillus tuaregi]
MSQNIEIEFKNMLEKEEFEYLMAEFQLTPADFFKQENHYFDTRSFSLKQKGCALRIREKQGQFEMTLKEPHPDGLLETNERLTKEEAHRLLQNGQIEAGIITTQLSKLGINIKDLHYFGTLMTERAEVPYKGGLLVLDSSSYLTVKDYEVEYEVTNRNTGKAIFLQLLREQKIPIRKTENKIKRFYDELKRMHP